MSERLAVDIGGTFVDAVRFDPASGVTVEKTPTTPANPTEGVVEAIELTDTDLESTSSFVHGTTLGINAYLERAGATTGIITNAGHRDVFEIGRISVPRSDMYNIKYRKPETLVPRFRRNGVTGRLDAHGEVLTPLAEDEVTEAARSLVDDHDVESIAVCFLHAYQNPDHERRAAELIHEAYPDLVVSLSSDISGELREYERTSTTVLDAYIKPVFESYVETLQGELDAANFGGSFFITRSGGGAFSAPSAVEAPVHTILSGPAGGLIGASHVSEKTSYDDLIAVDMGGTSLDACVVQDGAPAVAYESAINELPVLIPVYDIRTIGAGGGSIAWVDGDLLRVGPESAGADPGPICYGQGGTEPTVTDAAVSLGYLDPDRFLGGEMELATDAAIDGIETSLADPLGLSVEEASTGIFEVMFANTVGAIREITIERGLDPRDYSLFAYGGAGPMVIPSIAREMNVGRTIVPQAPSVFSAWGMLMTDVIYDHSQTHIERLSNVAFDDVDGEFETLEAEGRDRLDAEGFEEADRRFERSAEMRYVGQEHSVEVSADGIDDLDELGARFEREHESRYGHTMDDPPELVHLRVRAIGEADTPDVGATETEEGDAHVGTQEAYCFAQNARVTFDVYERGKLAPGETVEGPAVVQEPTTTVVIHSDQRAEPDEYGQLIVTTEDTQ